MTVSSGEGKWPLAERIRFHVSAPLYRNGYLLTLSSVGSAGFGIVFWALAAHLYPAAVVGVQSAVLSGMSLLAGLATLSLNNALIRYIQPAGKDTYRLVALSYLFSLIAAVIFSAIFLVSLPAWLPALSFLSAQPVGMITFTVSTAAWCIFSLQDYTLTGLRQTQWIPLENLLFSLAKIVLLFGFAGLLSGIGIFAAWNIPAILSLLPINFLIFRYLIPRHVTASAQIAVPLNFRQVFTYTSGNYLGTLFSLAATNLTPILVTTIAGATTNAYFYVPWAIVNGLQLLASNMATSLTVEATVDQTQLIKYSRRVLLQVTRLLLPVVLVIFVGAPVFLRIFGAAYAQEGAPVLRWLVLSAIPNALVVLGLGLARAQNRARVVALVQGAVSVLGLGLSLFLLPRLGLAGIGLAWLISQSCVALVLAVTLLRPFLWPGARP